MGPIQATKTCLAKSFTYSGRASRPEYWWFVLVTTVGFLAVWLLLDVLLLGYQIDDDALYKPFGDTFGLLILPATMSVTARRLQDRNLLGWPATLPSLALTALELFPNSGAITTPLDWARVVLLVLVVAIMIIAALPSSPGRNKYGANPNDPNPIEVFR